MGRNKFEQQDQDPNMDPSGRVNENMNEDKANGTQSTSQQSDAGEVPAGEQSTGTASTEGGRSANQ